MHRTARLCLIAFAGWTLACQAAVLMQASLFRAIALAPLLIGLLLLIERWILRSDREGSVPVIAGPALDFGFPALLGAAAALALLPVSWPAFWVAGVLMLAIAAVSSRTATFAQGEPALRLKRFDGLWIAFFGLACVLLVLALSRSDLDDAYYVAAAAFTASHPHAALLGTDPMFGEHGWSLMFPSYRFVAYEPLAAGIALLLHLPAMDVMYRVLPPLSALAMVAAVVFCTRELVPRHGVLAAGLALLLMLLLGEEHRSIANFGLDRLFQGKSLFVSIIVPVIYGLSFRFSSSRGRKVDLFLLACAQVAAVGCSNFAILAGPMAGAVAALAAAPPFSRANLRRFLALAATACTAVPYLFAVAIQSHGAAALAAMPDESPAAVWIGVHGAHQQYLIAMVLLLAPFLARTPLLRWRLALPPLIVLAVLLNPLLATFLSRHVTSPPVYWRVVWSFPGLIWLGAGLAVLIDRVRAAQAFPWPATATAVVAAALAAIAIPGNIFHPGNHVEWRFASRKLEPADLDAADEAIGLTRHGRLLAGDDVAGVAAMHEMHPPLVNVRSFYIDLLAPNMSAREYAQRKLLVGFVSDGPVGDLPGVRTAITDLDVETVVLAAPASDDGARAKTLAEAGLGLAMRSGRYAIWTRSSAPNVPLN